MNKTQLIAALSERTDLSKSDVKNVLESFEELVVSSCQNGEPVMLSGFVKFERKDRPARQGRNPMTGETIQIKAKSVAKVTPLKAFKDSVLAGPPKAAKKKSKKGKK